MNDLADPAQADPFPPIDVRSLDPRPETAAGQATVRRRTVLRAVAIGTVLVGLAGGGVWWHHQVTADPGLEFYGGPNVYRDEAATDLSGIDRKTNLLGDEVDVAFVA